MKKLTSIVVLILAILAAELLISYAKHFVHIKTGSSNPYLNTFIGMIVIVMIFYPIIFLSDWMLKKISHTIVNKTKKLTGSNIIGIALSFTLGFTILFFIYLKEWYGIIFYK